MKLLTLLVLGLCALSVSARRGEDDGTGGDDNGGQPCTSIAFCKECPSVAGVSVCRECVRGYGLSGSDTSLTCEPCPDGCKECKWSSVCKEPCGSDDTAEDGCDGSGGTCGEGCKECQAGVCTECIKSYGLDENGGCAKCPDNCKECELASFCKECRKSFGKDSSGNCVACPDGCKECRSGSSDDSSESQYCTRCGTSLGLDLDTGLCVSCTDLDAPDDCSDSRCLVSGGDVFCSCSSGPDGVRQGWDPDTQSCVPCSDANCKKCPLASSCFECRKGYYATTDGTCSQCVEGCRRCRDGDSCDKCSKGYTLEGRVCVPKVRR